MTGVAFCVVAALVAAPDTLPAPLSVPEEVLALLDVVRVGEELGEEEVAGLLDDPIDLSSVSGPRLAAIPFITREEVCALLELRDRLGGHLALADLAVLGRRGEQLARRLAPFVRSTRAVGGWSASLSRSARRSPSGAREASEARLGWDAGRGDQLSLRLYRAGPGTRALPSGAASFALPGGWMGGKLLVGGFRIASLLGALSDGGTRIGGAGQQWVPGGGVSEIHPVPRRSAPLSGVAAAVEQGGDILRGGLMVFASPARRIVTDADAGLSTLALPRRGGSLWLHGAWFDVAAMAVHGPVVESGIPPDVWSGGAEVCVFRPQWTAAFEFVRGAGEGVAVSAGLQGGMSGWECSFRYLHACRGFIPPLSAPWNNAPLRSQEDRGEASVSGWVTSWAELRAGFRATRRPSYARAIPLTTERDEAWVTLSADLARSVSLTGGVVSARTESGESSTAEPGTPAEGAQALRGTVAIAFKPGRGVVLQSRVGFVRGYFPTRKEGMVWTVDGRWERPWISASLRLGVYDVDAYDARVYLFDPAAGIAGGSVLLASSGWCLQATLRCSPLRTVHVFLGYAQYGPPPGRAGAGSRGIRCSLQGGW